MNYYDGMNTDLALPITRWNSKVTEYPGVKVTVIPEGVTGVSKETKKAWDAAVNRDLRNRPIGPDAWAGGE